MSEIHEIEQQTQQYIDYAFANEKIGQLRDICDEIELCYKEIMEVEDDNNGIYRYFRVCGSKF